MKHEREFQKTESASVSCGTTSSSIINIKLEKEKEKHLKKKNGWKISKSMT